MKKTKAVGVQHDMVNSPPHYKKGKYEVFEVLNDWFPDDPLAWQVVKYMGRFKHKGKAVEDLCKAQWYLNKLIEREKKCK